MKNKIARSLLLMCTLWMACSKDTDTDTGSGSGSGGNTLNCTPVPKTFTANVKPIFESSCQSSTCHGSGGNAGPGPLVTYAQINAARVGIRSAVNSGSMPKNGSLTTAQKNTILCWIDDGAKDN